MRLRQVAELLQAEVLWGEDRWDSLELTRCFAADLMSDVLACCDPGALLMTGLVSIQVVQTADVADLAAILFVGGKRPATVVVDSAKSKNLPLLVSPLTLFEVCGRLHAGGLLPSSHA